MPWPDSSLLSVRPVPNKGRGAFSTRRIEPGEPILCEAALAAAPLDQPELSDKTNRKAASWLISAQFVTVLLAQGPACVTRMSNLCPSAEELANEGSNVTADEVATVESLMKVFPKVDRTEVRRLLHVVNRNSFALDGVQALFERASMINHACMPNATQQAFRRASDGALCICIRAVTTIPAETEVTISYADDLAAPPSERASWLSHHGFSPDARPGIDAPLEEWLIDANSPKRKEAEPLIGALNVAADKAWQAAEAAGAKVAKARREMAREAAGRAADAMAAAAASAAASDAAVNAAPEVVAAPPDTGSTAAAVDEASTAAGAADVAAERTHYMTAAAYYAKLLQASEGVLGPRHALLLQARGRLAHVMTLSKAPRSCMNALPLWKAVLAQTKQCVPPNWPHLLVPLRGALDAATYAGDEASAKAYSEELDKVRSVLASHCRDVADGKEAARIVELSAEVDGISIS